MRVIRFSELFKIPLKNGLNRPTKDRGAGYKMINMGEIFAHDRIYDIEMERVLVSEKERHYFLEARDLLFARQSLVLSGAGKCSIFMESSEPTTFEGHIIRVRLNEAITEPLFYYYYFKSDKGRENIETIIEQVSAAGIRGSDLSNLTVPFPPLETQKEIAHCLGTIDNKIELNRLVCKTLEDTAQSIFNSWFVDFDPVHAKAAGKQLKGMNPEIADLFPDYFEDSELGKIPSGWMLSGLDSLGTFLNGLALQKYPATKEEWLPAIKIAQLRTNDTRNADKVSSSICEDYIVKDGDILFSWSGSLECVLWTGGNGALNQHLFRVTSNDYPKWFVYFWIHHHLPEFRHIAAGKATTMGHIQRHHLREAKVIIPPTDLMNMQSSYIEPLIDAIISRTLENSKLATIRDMILPKLISGDLSLSDTERIVGRSV